jgi:hypothetical protein
MQLESSVIAGIMIPDVLTPGQYYDGIRAEDSCARPIKRLMLAVLEDAMRCYQSYASSRNRAQRRLFVEAEGWLMDRKADGPFAFATVCETLGIDPSCLREGLRRWRLQQLDGLNPRRLARRSPVTRVGRISAPLKRRRRKASLVAAGDEASSIAAAVNGNGNGNGHSNGNGVAPHRNGLAHDGLGYGQHGEVESVNGSHRGADPGFSTRIEVQEAAVA